MSRTATENSFPACTTAQHTNICISMRTHSASPRFRWATGQQHVLERCCCRASAGSSQIASSLPYHATAVAAVGPKKRPGCCILDHDLPPELEFLVVQRLYHGRRGQTVALRCELAMRCCSRDRFALSESTSPGDGVGATERVGCHDDIWRMAQCWWTRT